ncbi:FCD domain-containing protein [Histophilus somni]|uniref:FCD domain-containing protein n=2 Tax=Histophilus somni TaxID=731 RepID=A0A9Q7E4R9_HISSO|nr:FCD domain-containing protein [Histophilus somni]ACA31703.1 GntR domain protein [Histophilus somni 2336]ARU64044.1 GntR family transcriptional regulator [Histophilus somni]ARU65825.1 GntR family transcriptional regulator [Histophilus somni]ARU67699.1 GntR family transcriptional regulator [Histophilus somni]ARU69579.1 GntR family transcriptional regulator [Histophilus somni]
MQNNSRTYTKIGKILKEEISQGKYKIGDKLPTERNISERFEVSRTIVREAIVMLEVEKIIEVRKGSGIYVIKIPDLLQEEADNKLRDVGPFELLQARQLLESSIAEFAAQQVTKQDILRLRQILDKEKELFAQNIDDCSADKEFHLALAEITGNDVLIQTQEQLWKYRFNNAMWTQLHSRIIHNDLHHLWIKDHETILNAIQRKNPALARKAMWQHLENVKTKLLELSDVEDTNFDGYLFNVNPVIVGI